MPQKVPSPDNFYALVLLEADRLALDHAAGLSGLDQDVAVARTIARTAVAQIPPDFRLALQGLKTAGQLRASSRSTGEDRDAHLAEAVSGVFDEIRMVLDVPPGEPFLPNDFPTGNDTKW